MNKPPAPTQRPVVPIGGELEPKGESEPNIEKSTQEAVKDTVKEAILDGINSVTGQGSYAIDPSEQARFKAEQQKKVQVEKAQVAHYRNWLSTISGEENRFKYNTYIKNQKEDQEKEEVKRIQQVQFQERKTKNDQMDQIRQRAQAERSKGKGVGG